MGLQSLKRWHWLVIGLVLGAVFAWTRLKMADAIRDAQLTASTLKQGRFERLLLATFRDKQRLIQDVVVHPLVTPVVINGVKHSHAISCRIPFDENIVIWKVAATKGSVPVTLVPAKFLAPDPYLPMGDFPLNIKGPLSIVDFLKQVKDAEDQRIDKAIAATSDAQLQQRLERSRLRYRYAWHQSRNAIIGLWGGGTLLGVGVIWPFIMSLLVGAGFGRPVEAKPEPKAQAKPAGKPKRPATPVVSGMSSADWKDLEKLEAELERKLTTGTEPAAAQVPDPAAPTPAPIRKLDAGPLETAATDTPAQDDRKYTLRGDDFYPVELPQKKDK